MGYRMFRQKLDGYSPYFLMFGQGPNFMSRLQHSEEEEPYPDAAATQLQVFLHQRGHV